MIPKIWCVLFALFLIYTGLVYVYSNPASRETTLSAEVSAGMKIWQEKNCHTCHQLYGLGGYMGPDLTNMVADKLKGPAYMKVFIQYGTAKMPNFQLTEKEVDQVIAFLQWVDKSGKNRVNPKSVHWTGTYIID